MFEDVSKWLDSIMLEGISEGEGVCFNLYEDGGDNWSMDIEVSEKYDPDDDDWACDPIYNSDEVFTWKQDDEWDEVFEDMIQILLKYMNEGKYADQLKENYKAIAVGFVDGDLELLYEQE